MLRTTVINWLELGKVSKKQRREIIKRTVLILAIVEPIMTIPQILEIWVNKQAAGVSALSWGFYIVAAAVWLLYGIQLRDKPLIISSSFWVVTQTAVFVGALIYG